MEVPHSNRTDARYQLVNGGETAGHLDMIIHPASVMGGLESMMETGVSVG